jgi:hypothetical protein
MENLFSQELHTIVGAIVAIAIFIVIVIIVFVIIIAMGERGGLPWGGGMFIRQNFHCWCSGGGNMIFDRRV